MTEIRDMIDDALAFQALERIDQLNIACSAMAWGDDGATTRKRMFDSWKQQAGIESAPERTDDRTQWMDLKRALRGY